MIKKLPDIYLFNPTCEYAVANGHVSWQPNRLLQKMEEDLDTLPLFLSGPGDIVLVKKRPSEEYLTSLEEAGFKIPEFVLLSDAAYRNYFQHKKLNCLLPWGWSPAAHRLLSPLKTSCSKEFNRSPVSKWDPLMRELYSKKFALEILREILPVLPGELVIQSSYIPEICTAVTEIEILLSRWKKLMIKAPWSTSGRGLQPITKTPVVDKVWEKISGMIKEQGYVITEPLLNKKLDMALQFELRKGKARYLGISRFFTDKKGKYLGNMINGWHESQDTEITHLADTMAALLINPLINAFENSRLAKLYEGFLGVDTLIYTDDKGCIRINPCLEINIRQNMGLLSLKLSKAVWKESKGSFHIWYQSGRPYLKFMQEMAASHPVRMKNNQIFSGFLSLTNPDEKSLFGAYMLTS